MRSIRHYLVALSLFLVLLVLAAGTLVVSEIERANRERSQQQQLATTRALSLVVDGELKRYESVLKVLAASDRIPQGDWAGFDREARALFHERDAWLVLSRRDGSQVVNTGLPPGSALPPGAAPPAMWRELDARGSRVCDLARGRIAPHILCVDVAAPAVPRAPYALSVIMKPDRLTAILSQQRVPPGTYTTVVDENGIVAWRNEGAQRFVGTPATPDMRTAIRAHPEGVIESHSLEGEPTVAAFSRSPYSHWTFIVAVPRTFAKANGNALPLAVAAAAVLIAVGTAAGLFAARRIARAAGNLAATAEQIQQGAAPAYRPSGLAEFDAAGRALQSAFESRKLSEDRHRLIFEQTSDLILTADLDQVITDCNESAAMAVGVPREQAIGRKISEFISPDDYARTTAMLRHKLGGGGTTQYEVRVRNSRGEWLHWEINSGLMYQADGTAIGLHVVGRDVTERKRSEERQQLLINELNHRVKNTLAIVQALAQQSFKGVRPASEESASFRSRLASLAAAHDLLTRTSWETVSLKDVVDQAVTGGCGVHPDRHRAEGPPILLAPQSAVSVAMAFHELCTNATKYGALSVEGGFVRTDWRIVERGGEEWLELAWSEHGGPPVAPPERQGFGTRMIERALKAELSAEVELDFRPEGLVCRVAAPLRAFAS